MHRASSAESHQGQRQSDWLARRNLVSAGDLPGWHPRRAGLRSRRVAQPRRIRGD